MASGKGGNMNSVKKVKTAIVGCGMISNIYIKNLKHLFSIIDLAAVCDVVSEAARQKAELYDVGCVMTIDEIAQSKEIELVVNLTGPEAHYEVIKKMLLAGKNVYTEKMMTTDLDKARELVKLAEERGLYLGVAPDTVLGAGVQTAHRVLDLGLIGKATSCQVSINRNQGLNSESFRFLRGNGGALPYDVGIYYIGALIVLFGPVKSVCAYGAPAPVHTPQLLFREERQESWQIPGNNLLCGVLKFKSGVLCTVHFDGNTIAAMQHRFMIYGTDGILEIGDPEKFDGYVKLIKAETGECLIPHTHGYNGKNYLSESTPFDGYGHRGIGVADLAWAMRQNRKNRMSKEYGLHCMEILCGMDIAAKTGSVYEINADFEVEPMKPGFYSTVFGGSGRGDAECSMM